jgi:hypothetical protein
LIKAFVTDWTEVRKTLAPTVEPTPTIPSIFATATVIIVMGSVGDILKATANMPHATADDIKFIALLGHNIGTESRGLKAAAF